MQAVASTDVERRRATRREARPKVRDDPAYHPAHLAAAEIPHPQIEPLPRVEDVLVAVCVHVLVGIPVGEREREATQFVDRIMETHLQYVTDDPAIQLLLSDQYLEGGHE